jgi:GDP-L-fucose synthase
MMSLKNKKIYIAGHKGMVGSAIFRILTKNGYTNLVGRSSSELDLRNQSEVTAFIADEKIEVVIDAAAKVGGILANSDYPYEFLMDNMSIQNNLIHGAFTSGVRKLIFLGSSCIYPKMAAQPIAETSLLTGPLEPSNQWYAIAKISAVKACEAIRNQYNYDYVSLMPTNLYGPYDNFDLRTSHVLPAMMRKFHEAKMSNHADVLLWGSGTPMREFLHVDDMASAVKFSLENTLNHHLYNVGTGKDLPIKQLALSIQKLVGHKGKILWDSSKPDGTPRKLLNVNRLSKEGWEYETSLDDGLAMTYDWFLNNINDLKELKISKTI